jgi:type IV pilus assembly protein PilB
VQVANRPDVASLVVGRTGLPALLIDRGLVSRNDLSVAERHAEREQIELTEALIALGLVPEAQAFEALAAAAGAPLVVLDDVTPSELAVRLVPERLARRYLMVPLTVDNRMLTYATCRPFDAEADRDLGFASGRRTMLMVASRTDLLDALDRTYPKLHDLDVLAQRLRIERANLEDDGRSEGESPSTVTSLCNHLIARAVEVGASDIHIECAPHGTSIRYRVCGVLEQGLALPASVSHLIRNRFKLMARADIAVGHKPQDGAFQVKVGGRPLHIRFSSLPTVDGEKLVMRVIDSQSPLQGLNRLGYDDLTLDRFQRALTRPDGLVLVTGPTGSGKTTALYAALAYLRSGHTNIASVEDPVERTMPGVTQVPVNERAGNSFASVLRSLLRQDPNVIMVSEVRDGEVAQIVGQAADTGHLVLTSMHTMDTATAITGLTRLGLDASRIAECLSAVLAQRLVRTLCPHCRRVHSAIDAPRAAQAHGLAALPASAGPGCDHCKHTGYLGRVPIAELLTPSGALRDAIAGGATSQEIRGAMREAGFPTIRDRALQLVVQGTTSMEEINRVLAADSDRTPVKSDRPRVLVVDDEPLTRMLVKLLLEREQFEVLEAEHGQQAVEVAVRERPDLTMIDLNMPEMDGFEAIRRMRRDFSLATMPIVVLTAEDGLGIERRVLELGADDYILKPFEPTVLVSRVHAVFRRLRVMAA